jgi:L-amino acid N-acyltransferase YncA
MIRSISPSDISPILQIYQHYILNSHVTFEEEVPTIEEFTTRVNDIHKKYPYLVFVENDQILGYAYANDWNSRSAYRFTLDVSFKDFYCMYFNSNDLGLTK